MSIRSTAAPAWVAGELRNDTTLDWSSVIILHPQLIDHTSKAHAAHRGTSLASSDLERRKRRSVMIATIAEQMVEIPVGSVVLHGNLRIPPRPWDW